MTEKYGVGPDAEAFRRGALRAAEARGRGAVRGANRERVVEKWGDGAFDPYPRTTESPTLDGMSSYLRRLGLDLIELGEQVARHEREPWTSVARLAQKTIETCGLVESLGKARTRALTEARAGISAEALNEERFANPGSALRSSFSALRKAGGRAEVAAVLVVHAHNLRENGKHDDAVQALAIAMPLAEAANLEERKRYELLGRLFQAASGVLRAVGARETALDLINESGSMYWRAGYRRGRAMAMLDRGGLLTSLFDDHQLAIAEISAAMELLDDPQAHRLMCSAYQLRALARRRLGKIDQAALDIAAAATHVPVGAQMLLGRVRWCQAEIALDLGRCDEAASWLEQAYELIPTPIVDRLLIVAFAIAVDVKRGRRRASMVLANERLPKLLNPIEKLGSKPLIAAYRQLYRATIEAASSAVLDRIVARIGVLRRDLAQPSTTRAGRG